MYVGCQRRLIVIHLKTVSPPISMKYDCCHVLIERLFFVRTFEVIFIGLSLLALFYEQKWDIWLMSLYWRSNLCMLMIHNLIKNTEHNTTHPVILSSACILITNLILNLVYLFYSILSTFNVSNLIIPYCLFLHLWYPPFFWFLYSLLSTERC